MIQDIDNSFTVILYTEISYKSAVIFSKFFFILQTNFFSLLKIFLQFEIFFQKIVKRCEQGI